MPLSPSTMVFLGVTSRPLASLPLFRFIVAVCRRGRVAPSNFLISSFQLVLPLATLDTQLVFPSCSPRAPSARP